MADPLVDDDGRAGFWINTEPTLDGKTYVVTLSVSQDFIVTLTPTRATAYASALLAACAQAEYDAAVFAQVTKRLRLGADEAVLLVQAMRGDRLPIHASGILFEPGVSERKKHPFVHFLKDGDHLGQMDVPSARRHALHVLEAPANADLDALYYRVLRGFIGVDEPLARAAVGNIGEHREPWTVADE